MRNRSQNERLAYEICCMSVWATICGWELANELTNQITTATQNRRMDKSDGDDKSVDGDDKSVDGDDKSDNDLNAGFTCRGIYSYPIRVP